MLRRGRRNGVRSGRGRRALGKGVRKTHPSSNPVLQFARSGCFVPSRTRVSLRFAVNYTAATSASYSQIAVSGNGLFDPGLSLSAGQPVGFDYWASMYERYRVIGSHIHVTVVNSSTVTGNNTANSTITVFPATASAALSTQSDANSQPYATTKDVTNALPAVIRKTMKTSTIVGVKDMEGADQLQALISGTPSNEWFWNIGIISGAAYTNYNLELEIQVTYDVEFFDRAQINRSTLEFIHKAYLANCVAIEYKYQLINNQREKAKSKFDEEVKHLKELKAGLQEIEDTQRREKYISDLVDEKSVPKLDIPLKTFGQKVEDNLAVHEKWLKLREADSLARAPPNTPAKKSLSSK